MSDAGGQALVRQLVLFWAVGFWRESVASRRESAERKAGQREEEWQMRNEAGFEQELSQTVWLALGQVDSMALSEAVTPDVEVRRLHWFDPCTGENVGLDLGSCEVGSCEITKSCEFESATRHGACRP